MEAKERNIREFASVEDIQSSYEDIEEVVINDRIDYVSTKIMYLLCLSFILTPTSRWYWTTEFVSMVTVKRKKRKTKQQRNFLESPVVLRLEILDFKFKTSPCSPTTHFELCSTYPNNTEEPDGASGSLVAAESAIFYQGTSLLVSPDG